MTDHREVAIAINGAAIASQAKQQAMIYQCFSTGTPLAKHQGMKQPIQSWRDRATKAIPTARCCWVCGKLGGQGFTLALKFAGYRMKPGEMGYAHPDCMRRAQKSCPPNSYKPDM